MNNRFYERAKDYEKFREKESKKKESKKLYEKEQEVWYFKTPSFYYSRYWEITPDRFFQESKAENDITKAKINQSNEKTS